MQKIGISIGLCLLAIGLSSCLIKRNSPKPFQPIDASQNRDTMVVGIFIYDGVYNTEVIAPYDVFQHAGKIAEDWGITPNMKVITIAPKLQTVTTAEGMRINPDHSFSDTPLIDILVIPSGENYEKDIKNREWIQWIGAVADRAKYITSHCWGAFLLAAAGQLEFKKATTYPPSVDQLQFMFPNVEVTKGVRFIQDGTVITSAGGIASFEASLFLIKHIYGEKMAKRIAGGLVFSPDNLIYSLPNN